MSRLPITPGNVLPAGTQSWGGYWTFITAAIVVLLILYLASNNQVSKWLSLFVYSAPTTPNLPATQTAVGAAQNALNTLGAGAVGAAATALGVDPAAAAAAGTAAQTVATTVQSTNPLTMGMKILNGALEWAKGK